MPTRPVSPYLQSRPSSAQKTTSAQKNKNMQQGNIFKSLSAEKSVNKATRSHYSTNSMNLKKVVPKSKSRTLGDNSDNVELTEENLKLKKHMQQQEKQLRKFQATIRRLEKINNEKDKLLDENHGNSVKSYGSSVSDPIALRKRIAKLQVQIMEKDVQIDELRSLTKVTQIAELQSVISVYQDEIERLQEIINIEQEVPEDEGDEMSRVELMEQIGILSSENRKLKTAVNNSKKEKLIRPSSARGSKTLTEAEKSKIARLSKQVKLLEAELAGQFGDTQPDEAEKRLRKTIEDLKQDQVDVDRDVQGYKRENVELVDEIKKLETHLKTLSDENDAGKIKLAKMSKVSRDTGKDLEAEFVSEKRLMNDKLNELWCVFLNRNTEFEKKVFF